jgi:hypothetical protein
VAFQPLPLDDDSPLLSYTTDQDRVLVVCRLRGALSVALNPPGLKAGPCDSDWDVLLSTEDPDVAPDPQPPRLDGTGLFAMIRFQRPGAVVLKMRI